MDEYCSREYPMHEPTGRGAGIEKTFAIKPKANAFVGLDPEIISRSCSALLVVPPFHGNAFGTLRVRYDVTRIPPCEMHWRSVRHFCCCLDPFRFCEQTDGTDGCKGI